MLIINKFHDYYDTAIAFGVDKTIVYKREPREEKSNAIRRNLWWREDEEQVGRKTYTYYKHVIGFCGDMFPVLEIIEGGNLQSESKSFLYSEREVEDYMKEKGIVDTRRFGIWPPLDRQSMSKFFNKDEWSEHKSKFIDNKVPVFAFTTNKIVYNPCLKDFKFAKVKDPFTAFQDISQYISGVLGVGDRDMIEISDVDRRDKKGFDKWSFRTHPEDSKKPRKRK